MNPLFSLGQWQALEAYSVGIRKSSKASDEDDYLCTMAGRSKSESALEELFSMSRGGAKKVLVNECICNPCVLMSVRLSNAS